MCTSIVEIVGAEGAGKGGDGWFALTHSVVSYDHPHHALLEDAGIRQGAERRPRPRDRRGGDRGKPSVENVLGHEQTPE
jgi:hypothetical protein